MMSKTINKKTICITGKIGSGKTEASKILIKNGYDVLNHGSICPRNL